MSKKEKAKHLLTRLEKLEAKRFSVSGGGDLAAAVEHLLNEDAKPISGTSKEKAQELLQRLNVLADDMGVLDLDPVLSAITKAEKESADRSERLFSEFTSKLEKLLSQQAGETDAEINTILANVGFLTDEFTDKFASVQNADALLQAEIEKLRQDLSGISDGISSGKIEIYRDIESTKQSTSEISKRFQEFTIEINRRIASFHNNHGGNANRNIAIGSNSSALSRYTDINLIAGSGLTISYANNDTTKQADITVSASAGAGINPQVPAGTINSSNAQFTCTGLVKVAFADGTLDINASIAGAANSTITYSVPPQNNVYAF